MRCGSGSRAGGVEIEAVDDVAAIGRQRDAVLRLGVGGARLGELAGEAADLDHRAGGAEGQHHRHLQQHLEGVADVVRVELGEALGAVAALQQKGLAGRDIGEPVLQPPRLAGEDQRREAAQRLLDPGERRLVGITRHLPDRQAAPAPGRPFIHHDISACSNGGTGHGLPPDVEAAPFWRHSVPQKHESRLDVAAFGTNASAISLCRRPIRRIVKSRKLGGPTGPDRRHRSYGSESRPPSQGPWLPPSARLIQVRATGGADRLIDARSLVRRPHPGNSEGGVLWNSLAHTEPVPAPLS